MPSDREEGENGRNVGGGGQKRASNNSLAIEYNYLGRAITHKARPKHNAPSATHTHTLGHARAPAVAPAPGAQHRADAAQVVLPAQRHLGLLPGAAGGAHSGGAPHRVPPSLQRAAAGARPQVPHAGLRAHLRAAAWAGGDHSGAGAVGAMPDGCPCCSSLWRRSVRVRSCASRRPGLDAHSPTRNTAFFPATCPHGSATAAPTPPPPSPFGEAQVHMPVALPSEEVLGLVHDLEYVRPGARARRRLPLSPV
jgi:hypothetical protein